MRKTVYMTEKKEAAWKEGNYLSVPYIKFMNGKWRQDNWYFKPEEEKEFVRARRKEGFLIS